MPDLESLPMGTVIIFDETNGCIKKSSEKWLYFDQAREQNWSMTGGTHDNVGMTEIFKKHKKYVIYLPGSELPNQTQRLIDFKNWYFAPCRCGSEV